MSYLKDDFVKLPEELGGAIGRVTEDVAAGKVRIQFPGEGIRVFRLDLCSMIKVEDSEETRAIAERLKPSQRKVGGPVRPLPELITLFKSEFPDGFEGKKYEQEERGPKVKASERMRALLGKESMQSLLQGQRFEEISRQASLLLTATNLPAQFDVLPLRNALKAPSSWQPFSEALFELLYGEGQRESRFARFVSCLASLDAAKWPVATYFPFLATPQTEIFLKPEATKIMAAACEVDLNYRSLPNWLTYSSLLNLSEKLTVALIAAALRPKDMIDVQSFIWAVVRLDKSSQPASTPPESPARQ